MATFSNDANERKDRPMRSCLPLVLLACLLVTPEPAAAGKPTKPASPPPAKAKSEQPSCASLLRLPQNVTLATLSNGLTVIVQENHMAAVATVRSFVKNTGSAYESKNLGAGLSHVLEHVVAGGSTSHRTEKEIEHECGHVDRHDDVLHRLSRQKYPGRHRVDRRRHAAREVRALRVCAGVDGRAAGAGRRRSRSRPRALESALADDLHHASRPPPHRRLSRRAERHDEPDDHGFLPQALRAQQSDLRGGRRREHATGARSGGQAVYGHAAEPRDVRSLRGRAGAAFAPRGLYGNGRCHLRSGAGLAHGETFAPGFIRPRRGRLHSRRGGELAAGRAAEV